MKKIISKIRNILITTGLYLITGAKNVFGVQIDNILIPREQSLYAVEDPVVKPKIWSLFKVFIIPIAFIIGSIIYLNKSKSSKTRKLITLLIALLLTIGICFGINYFINK